MVVNFAYKKDYKISQIINKEFKGHAEHLKFKDTTATTTTTTGAWKKLKNISQLENLNSEYISFKCGNMVLLVKNNYFEKSDSFSENSSNTTIYKKIISNQDHLHKTYPYVYFVYEDYDKIYPECLLYVKNKHEQAYLENKFSTASSIIEDCVWNYNFKKFTLFNQSSEK